MKKFDLGQTISILANVGVIVGIAFLALEISQNNEQLASQARYNYYQGRIQASRDIAVNSELAGALAKALTGEQLSPGELTRLYAWGEAALASWEYEYWEYVHGQITPEEFNVAGKRGRYEALRPVIGSNWEQYKQDAPEDFVEFMEREIVDQ